LCYIVKSVAQGHKRFLLKFSVIAHGQPLCIKQRGRCAQAGQAQATQLVVLPVNSGNDVSKYDFQLDMQSNDSHAVLLKLIRPGSSVLEFGPADGAMTEYMAETLRCAVFIVELDESSYNNAIQYAADGYLGDIDSNEWTAKLENQSFDCILFADVLEHLVNPEAALRKAIGFLKEGGRILMSVPNIAHNAVIADLLRNRFTYRPMGLLDETHLRFFAYHSLKELLARLGLSVIEERGTCAFPEETEFANACETLPVGIGGLLQRKEFGTVYQFIFACVRTDYYRKNPENIEIKRYIGDIRRYDKLTLYIERNGQFSENVIMEKTVSDGQNDARFDLSEHNASNVRIDFGNKPCIVRLDALYLNETPEPISALPGNDAARIKNLLVFTHGDPYLFCARNDGAIQSLRVVFSLESTAELPLLELAAREIGDLNDLRTKEKSEYDAATRETDASLAAALRTIEEKAERLDEAKTELNERENELLKKENELNERESELRETKIELSERENELCETKSRFDETKTELAHYSEHYHAAIQQRNESRQLSERYKSMYESIANATFWKLTRPLRLLAGALKITVRRMPGTKNLYKTLHFLKLYGAKATAVKIKSRLSKENAYRPQSALSDTERQTQEHAAFKQIIKFSILTPLYNTPEKFLCEMIESVQAQTYRNWELCLADGSDERHSVVANICKRYAKKDGRIKYKKLEKNLGISENTNAATAMATGDYMGLLDHDDLLHPSALFEAMKAICDKNADVVYTDEDKTDERSENYFEPHFKPDFSIDYLRTINYVCHFLVFKKTLLHETGGFQSKYDGAQDHDLILRLTEKAENIVHIPKILYHWRAISDSTARDPSVKIYTSEAGIKAVTDHLTRCGLPATVAGGTVHPNIYRIHYEIIGNPLVSIIIPNKDHLSDLKKCVDSVVNKTTYSNYEIIIVENNSETTEIFDYYKIIEQQPNVKVLLFDGAFNFSRINNFAVSHATGDYIILLNNDIEVISPNWIEEMLMYAQRPDVGAVGAKLYYPDNTVQHAGVILGIGSVAGHPHKYFNRNDPGYIGRLITTQNLSAVTGACMMIPKRVYNKVNGFDERFGVAFNDVDICMRIRKEGYLIAFTPFAELYHCESKSRGTEDTPQKQKRFSEEVLLFRQLWKRELEAGDPYYNPNLTLDREDFSMR
jgi:GT2 family glycosyltransferase/2-polyprenyl-3-methyl-5-hydroxy-6-metoxy-1,4-benzoquinol methylase